MNKLTPSEVKDAAPCLLSPELHSELLAARKLEGSWSDLVETLKWRMGFNRDALQAALSTTYQGRGESLESYVSRFRTLHEDAETDPGTAARWFVWNMTEEGRNRFAARLERKLGAPEDPAKMERRLAKIPLEEQFKLASGGEWLSWIGTATSKRKDAHVLHLEPIIEEDVE
jgi:hypothetical protein